MQGENWLGVALSALMKIPPQRAAWLGNEALRRLSAAPLNGQQRFLLGDCVQAYLPLDEAQQREFDRIAEGDNYGGVKAMNLTSYDKGVAAERRRFLAKLLAARFGPLSRSLMDRLQKLNLDELDQLGESLLAANSLAELGLNDDVAE